MDVLWEESMGEEAAGREATGREAAGEEATAYLIEEAPEEYLQLMQEENGVTDGFPESTQTAGMMNPDTFVQAGKATFLYNWEDFISLETLVGNFYTIDSSTRAREEYMNLSNLLGKDMTLKTGAEPPQILIYHTHSQEAFADSLPGDKSTTIVGAGDLLTQILTEEYGYNVLHYTGEYDVPVRDYAYSKSLPSIEQLLQENPSIEVVIDLHRDGVKEDVRLVKDVDGKPTAQFMFFNGLSYTDTRGEITYLPNPNLGDNLAFSFQMQVAANQYYPGITRKIYLNGYRYNMHLKAKTLLVELGGQTNTVEEIQNAVPLLAHVLDLVLSGEAASGL